MKTKLLALKARYDKLTPELNTLEMKALAIEIIALEVIINQREINTLQDELRLATERKLGRSINTITIG